MKKLLLFMLVLVGGVGQVWATKYQIKFIRGANWSDNIYAHVWEEGVAENTTTWPGVKMTKSSEETFNGVYCVFTCEIDCSYVPTKIIISDNGDDAKRIEESFVVDKVYLATEHYMHLHNNISGWDSDTYYSPAVWDGSCDNYVFVINSADLGENDFQFRLKRNSDSWDIEPYNHTAYPFVFTNGQSEIYNANTNAEFQGTSQSFQILHSSIKASQYKITVKMAFGDPWTYEIKAEIVSMPVEIKSVGAATFSCNRALDFSSLSSSFTAKTITGVSGVTLTKSDALTTVPANTGLYLEGTAGTYDVPVIETDAASAVGTNLLIAQSTAGSVSQTVGEGVSKKTNYILTNMTVGGPADLKFYKVYAGGNTVGAGKAYLQIDTPEGGGLAREYLWFDETTTGVSEQVAAKSGNAGAVYNLSGQRVAQPARGLYIVNGKKYIVK